jgi:hypothetical protein
MRGQEVPSTSFMSLALLPSPLSSSLSLFPPPPPSLSPSHPSPLFPTSQHRLDVFDVPRPGALQPPLLLGGALQLQHLRRKWEGMKRMGRMGRREEEGSRKGGLRWKREWSSNCWL